MLLAVFAFTVQSCLHDDEELFDIPAANRIQNVVASHKQILESSPNGWEMHFYSGEDYSGGGYTFLIRFADGKAHVSSDLSVNTSLVSTSSYDVIKDMGPVLTFNTYNELIHYLAQPYQSNVEGEQGDFEFLILEATADSVRLKGKKWKNEIKMTRIPESVVWKDYLDQIKAINDKLNFIYTNKVNDQEVSTLYIQKDSRRVTLVGENMPESAYYVTSTGIHLYEPIDLGNGTKISDLVLDPATGMLTDITQPSLKILKSDDEAKNLDISKIFGTWDMSCKVLLRGGTSSNKTLKVDFEAIKNELDTPYSSIVKGTIHNGDDDYNFYLYYLADKGHLRLGSNYVEDPTKQHNLLQVYGWDDDDNDDIFFKYDSEQDKLIPVAVGSTIAFVYEDVDENGEQGLYLYIAFSSINSLTNHVKNE